MQDVIKLNTDEIILDIEWAPSIMTDTYKKKERDVWDTQTQRENSHKKKEAEIGMLHLQAKIVAGSHQMLRDRLDTNPPSEPGEATNTVHILILDFLPPEL